MIYDILPINKVQATDESDNELHEKKINSWTSNPIFDGSLDWDTDDIGIEVHIAEWRISGNGD